MYKKLSFPIFKKCLLFIFCISVLKGNAQTYPIWENGGYGLIDATGKVVFPTIARDSEELRQPLIICFNPENSKYGLVNRENKKVIDANYYYISRLETGFLISTGDRAGFVNAEGKIILPTKFKNIYANEKRLIAENDSTFCLMDLQGNKISTIEYQSLSFIKGTNELDAKQNGKSGIIDSDTKVIIPFNYDNIMITDVDTIYAVEQKGKSGAISKKGTILLPCIYERVDLQRNSSTNHFFFTFSDKSLMGYANFKRSLIVKPQYENISFAMHDQMILELKGKKSVADSTGKIILTGFTEIKQIGYTDLYSTQINKLWGVHDSKGKVIIPNLYKEEFEYDSEGYFSTNQNKKTIYFDLKGKPKHIFSFNIDSLEKKCQDYSFLNVQLFGIKKGGKWGTIDHVTGKSVMACENDSVFSRTSLSFMVPGQAEAQPGEFDYMERQFNYVSANNSIDDAVYVLNNGKVSVLDSKGKIIIPAEYDNIELFYRGRARVYKNGKYGYIHSSGQVLIPAIFDTLDEPMTFEKRKLTTSNFLLASKNKKFGVVDSSGKTIIDFLFDSIGYFGEKNFAFVKQGGKTGVIDRKGNFLIKPQVYPIEEYNGMGYLGISGSRPIIYVNAAGEEVWHNKDDSYLSVAYFQGNGIPENIGYMKELTTYAYHFGDPDILGVGGSVMIPKSFYDLTKLEYINFEYKLLGFDPDIKKLKNLKVLKANYYDPGFAIPKEIGELKLLDTLELETYATGSYGEIPTPAPLPAEIANLTSLKHLKTGLNFTTLPKQLKSLECGQGSDSVVFFDRLLNCSELEYLTVSYGYGSSWGINSFMKVFSSFKNLKRVGFSGFSDYEKCFFMQTKTADIDTLIIRGIYSQSDTLSPELYKRNITYLETNYDTLAFSNLLHLKFTENSLFYLPRGLSNCTRLKKLEIGIRSGAEWKNILQDISKLPELENLTLTIQPDYYEQHDFSFDDTFYTGIKALISKGKLKNLNIRGDLFSEACIQALKQIQGVSLTIN